LSAHGQADQVQRIVWVMRAIKTCQSAIHRVRRSMCGKNREKTGVSTVKTPLLAIPVGHVSFYSRASQNK